MGLGNVAGQTYAQLLKRPEISLEGLLPVLRPEWEESGGPLEFLQCSGECQDSQ